MSLWHFFVLRKPILQTRMCRQSVGLDVWILVGPFVYFQTSCVRTAKALARRRGCAGSPEHSLVAYVINTLISWAGSFMTLLILKHTQLVQCSPIFLYYFTLSEIGARLDHCYIVSFFLLTWSSLYIIQTMHAGRKHFRTGITAGFVMLKLVWNHGCVQCILCPFMIPSELLRCLLIQFWALCDNGSIKLTVQNVIRF